MKKTLLALLATGTLLQAAAQTDSTREVPRADTIRVGGMIIIKRPGEVGSDSGKTVILSNRKHRKPNSNISTNWWIVDLGFANLNDRTDYAAAAASGFTTAGINEETMKLRTGKSVNVNLWVFMQRMNLIKHVVNLKYGLGVELNNYRFDDERVRLEENPTRIRLDETLRGIEKNKLAADYVTLPIMLNLNFTPGRNKGFGLSGGVSAGYLYSSRQKTKIEGDKEKLHDDFDLRKWKLSYIGEVNLGPVRVYGSYALKSMWEKGLDQTPYNVGLRLSNW